MRRLSQRIELRDLHRAFRGAKIKAASSKGSTANLHEVGEWDADDGASYVRGRLQYDWPRAPRYDVVVCAPLKNARGHSGTVKRQRRHAPGWAATHHHSRDARSLWRRHLRSNSAREGTLMRDDIRPNQISSCAFQKTHVLTPR